jgi:hypothetical protein
VTAARPVLAGLGLLLWAFGTWLILLLLLGVRLVAASAAPGPGGLPAGD